MNNNRLTISNILILLSIIATLLAFVFPNLYMFGINSDFLNERNYLVYFVQFFTGTFLHL